MDFYFSISNALIAGGFESLGLVVGVGFNLHDPTGADFPGLAGDVFVGVNAGVPVENGVADVGEADAVGQDDIVMMHAASEKQSPRRQEQNGMPLH